MIKRIFITIFAIACWQSSHAQTSQVLFGKNRIQYKQFNWQYLSTTNFDIYYYEGGKELAQYAAFHAEKEFERITNIIGYSPYTKTKLIIYNSIPDYQQTNIGLPYERYVLGGQTNFVKSRAAVAFPGTQVGFRKEISYQLAYNLVNEMIYGNSLKELIQSSYFLSLPEWYISGIANYLAHGWSVEMDDFIRDALVNEKLKKPAQLIGRDAALTGQSIWNFIVEKYGKGTIATMLNLTRISRSVDMSVMNTYSMSYDMFIYTWQEYYTDMLNNSEQYFADIDEEKYLFKRSNKETIYSDIKLSPDTTYVAYSYNKKSKYRVKLRNLETGKRKTLVRRNINNTDLSINLKVPLLVWKDNTTLLALEEKRGKLFITSVKRANGAPKLKFKFTEYSHILKMDIDQTGNKLLFTGVKNGQADIYLYNFVTGKTVQITNDVADDLDAVFVPDTEEILFSSNRLSDTLSIGSSNFRILGDNFNIYKYDYKAKTGIAKQMTFHYGKETKPLAVNSESFYFLSEASGIRNMYKYDTAYYDGALLSNNIQNIKFYDVQGNKLIFMSLYNRKERVFIDRSFAGDNFITSDGKTIRQEILDNAYLNLIDNKDTPASNPIRTSKKEETNAEIDTVAINDQLKNLATLDPDEVDINNYLFEEEKEEVRKKLLKQKEEAVRATEEKEQKEEVTEQKKTISVSDFSLANRVKEIKPTGPYKYKRIMSLDRTLTSMYLDNLRGLGTLLEAGMTDMFENHRFYGGLFGMLDLRSSNYYGEYSYLRNRIDFKGSFLRQTYFYEDEYSILKFNLNEFKATAIYPFTAFHSLRFSPLFSQARVSDFVQITSRDSIMNFVGQNTEFIMDNTNTYGPNLIEGTRFKFGLFTYMSLEDKKQNFARFNFDFRHYQKLHRELTFAVRVAYGQFLGSDAAISGKNYLLGGMDSWVFRQSNQVLPSISTPADLWFLSYATNLRGFKHNAKFGNNYILANLELRFPIVKYFHQSPISSGFLRNFQIVGFYDVGSAWSGRNPFNKNNTLNTQTFNYPPYSATVINYRNPFLYGYGFGFRTMVLGYYAKMDFAWGVEDYRTNKVKLYLTLGYDF